MDYKVQKSRVEECFWVKWLTSLHTERRVPGATAWVSKKDVKGMRPKPQCVRKQRKRVAECLLFCTMIVQITGFLRYFGEAGVETVTFGSRIGLPSLHIGTV